MEILVVILRIVSLLAFAGPITLKAGRPKRRLPRKATERAPVVANLAAFVVFLVLLFVFWMSPRDSRALLSASLGVVVAIAGATLVLRSRAALGNAWSLAPNADQATGLVTSGPYARMRHPIYVGLTLLAAGQAVAFGSWPAFAIVLLGLVPTFAWRARAEERLLSRTFGERYAEYRPRLSSRQDRSIG
jgi:protein-S-isoprenylcysteine O-methyltransferase Ste14